MMAIRKRFIAGAMCPVCRVQDTMAMWREGDVDIVQCVKCGYQMRKSDNDSPVRKLSKQQLIGIFHPD